MKKEFYLLEMVQLVGMWNSLTEEKRNAIPFKVYYQMKRAIAKLLPDVNQYEETRNEELRKIQEKYANDERSEEYTEDVVDENGNPVLDENGNQKTESGRRVKKEWIGAYQKEIGILDNKLREILSEKYSFEYNTCNIEKIVNDLPDDSPLESSDIDLIDALLSEN